MSGPFATINGLRLGRLVSVDVPAHEVQNALLVLCRFLVYQMRVCGLDPVNIRLGAGANFVTHAGAFELRFPRRSRDNDSFNAALAEMMGCFHAVFMSPPMRTTTPANLIDVARRKINAESFLYAKAEPANFTRAMRKLVVNLKTVQAYQILFTD
jgi:hypothetical protein